MRWQCTYILSHGLASPVWLGRTNIYKFLFTVYNGLVGSIILRRFVFYLLVFILSYLLFL